LRRALDREEVETRRLMASKTGELRLLLLGHAVELKGLGGLEIVERIDIRLSMERPLFDPPEPIVVDTRFPSEAKLLKSHVGELGQLMVQEGGNSWFDRQHTAAVAAKRI
jgi:hypothetical protein